MSKRKQPFEIDIDGQLVRYTVRRSARARRWWLKVSPEDGLVVVQPRGMTQADIPAVLRSEADWIRKHLDRMASSPPPALPSDVDNGTEILFRGERRVVRVSLTGDGSRLAAVRPNGESIDVCVPLGFGAPVRNILEAWMRHQAKRLIHAEAHRLATAHDLSYNRIFIRDQKTKWGSCSSRGNVSFNWRLVMAPPHVLTYLVAHELAHLKEFGHSEAFWRVLAEICPGYEEAKSWLNDYGHSLRF